MGGFFRTKAFRYGLIGTFLGLGYALMGLVVEGYVGSRGAYLFIQAAPVLFGIFSFIIGREEDRVRTQTVVLDEARQRFSSLTNAAIAERNWDVSFYDSHIPTCWQVKNCTAVDCPSYGEHHVRCWLVAGTFCRGEVQGRFAQKLGNCTRCEVYQESVGKDSITEIAENFNSIMWALREKEDMLAEARSELKSQFTELEALQEKTREMADSDPLTGLRNHGHFQKRLQEEAGRAKRYGRPLSLMLLDLDHFKHVNDQFGHQKGDEVLKEVGILLTGEIRDCDYAARYGGEEFVVLMPEIIGSEAIGMAERLRLKMDKVARNTDLPVHLVGTSIGVADLPVCATDGGSLVSAADSALLFAKRKGRNQVAYFRDLSETDLSDGDLELLNGRLEGVCFQTIRALAEAVDARDQYSSADTAALANLAGAMADRLGMARDQVNALTLATRLHDIGKIGVPDSILGKKERLSPEELSIVRRHPEMGKRILQEAEQIHDLIAAILYHHECWDGNGYPEGLMGDEIPMSARIVGIIDAYRAMCSDRPYRKALNQQQVIAELRKGAGSQFDPGLVEMFVEIVSEENRRHIRRVS